MDSKKIESLIQFALIVASEEDEFSCRHLGAIHLIKYVYLADLANAEKEMGQTYTDVEWRFHHFGPWSLEVFKQIEPSLSAIGAIKNTYPSKYEDDSVRWRLNERLSNADKIENQIDPVPRQAIKKWVHKFGSDTESLLKHVYLTKPMLTAAPGGILNFEQDEALANVNDKRDKTQDVIISNKKLAKAKQAIQLRLAEEKKRRAEKKISHSPRYDDIFLAGQEWLDSLAGEPIEQTSGEASFSENIWKSKSRFDPDVS